jgi:hypothetical protein
MATLIWLLSFTRATIMWRGYKYFIRDGQLEPAVPIPGQKLPEEEVVNTSS